MVSSFKLSRKFNWDVLVRILNHNIYRCCETIQYIHYDRTFGTKFHVNLTCKLLLWNSAIFSHKMFIDICEFLSVWDHTHIKNSLLCVFELYRCRASPSAIWDQLQWAAAEDSSVRPPSRQRRAGTGSLVHTLESPGTYTAGLLDYCISRTFLCLHLVFPPFFCKAFRWAPTN